MAVISGSSSGSLASSSSDPSSSLEAFGSSSVNSASTFSSSFVSDDSAFSANWDGNGGCERNDNDNDADGVVVVVVATDGRLLLFTNVKACVVEATTDKSTMDGSFSIMMDDVCLFVCLFVCLL